MADQQPAHTAVIYYAKRHPRRRHFTPSHRRRRQLTPAVLTLLLGLALIAVDVAVILYARAGGADIMAAFSDITAVVIGLASGN